MQRMFVSINTKKNVKLGIIIILICTIFTLIIFLNLRKEKTEDVREEFDKESEKACSPWEENIIYPAVSVNGICYKLERDRFDVVLMTLDKNSTQFRVSTPDDKNYVLLLETLSYYGKLKRSWRKIPLSDREFVSAFKAQGLIYTDPNDEEHVYLVLTTDWIDDAIVAFKKCEDN